METQLERARLPLHYDTYVFDLYGTLVDIRTQEDHPLLWEKLALFYGYYEARYTPAELRMRYAALVSSRERALKRNLERAPEYAHEAYPEIEITGVFRALFTEKGISADDALAVHAGQFFRILSTEYVRLYQGTAEMLSWLQSRGKRIYLLSNAQRIFTEFEMHTLGIAEYFDDILISSDHQTRKPDRRFFDILLARHAIDVHRTLFVGNDSRTDIAGARQVGMDTFYVCSNISPRGDAAPDADFSVPDFNRWEAE